MKSLTNNDIYNDLADSWWDENGIQYLLKAMVNPWRVPFFEQVLIDHYGTDLSKYNLLDVGCGGGVLTEEFSRMGCQVTGMDTSERSIQVAMAHAETEGLEIKYQVGSALELNFPDNSFYIVSCCDVLEHIPDWEKAITEISRVLKPNGLFLFDTINRTLLSWFLFIFGLQELPITSLFPRKAHDWRMFITPYELRNECEMNGIQLEEVVGGALDKNPLIAFREVRRYKAGAINSAELGGKLVLRKTKNLMLNYIGYGIKYQH